jgi:peptidoglycan/LPS O-acetylase OafA/YrhL
MSKTISDAIVRTERAEALDVLRFALAVWVLVTHVTYWAPTTTSVWLKWLVAVLISVFQPAIETHPAVLAFIVLSGYCIHRNGLRARSFTVTPYAIRRAFRIVPMFVLAAVGGALVGKFVLNDPTVSVVGLLQKLSGISAFVPALNTVTYQGNAPLHTVMVEIWLYAFYPVAIFLLSRRGSERALWLLLGAICLAGTLAARTDAAVTNWWHNGSFFGFLIYWWIGAWFVNGRLSRRAIILILCCWLALSAVLIGGWSADLVLVEARKLCFAFLIGAFIAKIDCPAKLALGRLGQASYSFYALHTPVTYGLIASGVSWWLAMFAALPAGLLAFVVVEAPLMRLGRQLAQSSAGPANTWRRRVDSIEKVSPN